MIIEALFYLWCGLFGILLGFLLEHFVHRFKTKKNLLRYEERMKRIQTLDDEFRKQGYKLNGPI